VLGVPQEFGGRVGERRAGLDESRTAPRRLVEDGAQPGLGGALREVAGRRAPAFEAN
jgi:hypothetical protein